jgi:hypothetical protein
MAAVRSGFGMGFRLNANRDCDSRGRAGRSALITLGQRKQNDSHALWGKAYFVALHLQDL